jgi:hypothetical protein
MIATRFKLWRTLGAAAMIAGCAPGGEAGEQAAGAPRAASHGEAGESAIGEGGGESGEAGAASAYAGLPSAGETALRLQHLKGFLLLAQDFRKTDEAAAAALVGQGLLEVYDAKPAAFAGLDVTPIRAASTDLAKLDPALAAIKATEGPADSNLVKQMIVIANGLYAGVLLNGEVDTVEYQHALGAALAARDALNRAEPLLKAKDAARFTQAKGELDRFIALWPGPTAPAAPTPIAQVAAQASRVELALSGL